MGAAFLRAGTAKDLTLADVGIWGISFVTPDGCCCSQCPAAPCWNLLGQTEDLLSEILTQYCLWFLSFLSLGNMATSLPPHSPTSPLTNNGAVAQVGWKALKPRADTALAALTWLWKHRWEGLSLTVHSSCHCVGTAALCGAPGAPGKCPSGVCLEGWRVLRLLVGEAGRLPL